ncbi:hypothetical protein BDQ17DRAFT_1429452 [Cyathus striatus]|nr:hypothetical protein BDQ17DRAFT_1439257 [Cyathus striatus]KAF8996781.1 hypothetical protein BDQ17DRAFT_1429452 [Cyathus striatus]
MDVVKKENDNESSGSESSGSEDGADVAIDVNITPKKAKPVLKCGHASSSPHAKPSDIKSVSKVSQHSISHSSATFTLSEMFMDYLQSTSHTVEKFLHGHAADLNFVIMNQQSLSDFHDVLESLENIYSPVANVTSVSGYIVPMLPKVST